MERALKVLAAVTAVLLAVSEVLKQFNRLKENLPVLENKKKSEELIEKE